MKTIPKNRYGLYSKTLQRPVRVDFKLTVRQLKALVEDVSPKFLKRDIIGCVFGARRMKSLMMRSLVAENEKFMQKEGYQRWSALKASTEKRKTWAVRNKEPQPPKGETASRSFIHKPVRRSGQLQRGWDVNAKHLINNKLGILNYGFVMQPKLPYHRALVKYQATKTQHKVARPIVLTNEEFYTHAFRPWLQTGLHALALSGGKTTRGLAKRLEQLLLKSEKPANWRSNR